MDQIEKKILGLQQSQYEIRFPGGKGYSNRSSHASFGAIVRENDDRTIEVLVVPYLKTFTGDVDDDNEKVFPEDPEQTLAREIQEETGILINRGAYFFMSEKMAGEHKKIAYLVYEFDDSNLRTKTSPYQQNIGTPFWCPLHLLQKYVSIKHKWIMENVVVYARMTPLKRVSENQKTKGFTDVNKGTRSSLLAYL